MPTTFRSQPSFRLNLLATVVERQIGLRYQRKFDLKVNEARIVGIVASTGAIGLKRICADVALDKSSASRYVARLVDIGLLQKIEDTADQRTYYLSITGKGKRMYQELLTDAQERNAEWMEVLPEARREAFVADLDTLLGSARAMLREEEEQIGKPGDAMKTIPLDEGESSATLEKRPILLNENTALQLMALLQKLVNQ